MVKGGRASTRVETSEPCQVSCMGLSGTVVHTFEVVLGALHTFKVVLCSWELRISAVLPDRLVPGSPCTFPQHLLSSSPRTLLTIGDLR